MRKIVSKFTLAAGVSLAMVFTLGIALTGCAINSAIKSIDRTLDSALGGGKKYETKVNVSDNLIYKEADHTWEVTDQASWNIAASGINNAGEGKKHIVTVKNSFTLNSSFYTSSFYLTATNIAVVIEGNATISFFPVGRTTYLLDVGNKQAIIVRDLKLQGNGSNTTSLVSVWEGGTFIMEGSASVSGNTARGSSRKFGGACGNTSSPGGVYVKGTFVMRDNASVYGNASSGNDCHGREFGQGGGVEVQGYGAKFIMQDNASVTGNTAAEYGGGVYVNGQFGMQDNAKVSGNTARNNSDVYGMISPSVSYPKRTSANSQKNEESKREEISVEPKDNLSSDNSDNMPAEIQTSDEP